MDNRNFRGLEVWQLGMKIAEQVYLLSRRFPKHETYALCRQMQRAAVSVPSNIAEGQALGSSREFSRFLAIAQGSLAELETQLLLVERLRYASHAEVEAVIKCCTQEARMLRSLRSKVKQRIEKKE